MVKAYLLYKKFEDNHMSNPIPLFREIEFFIITQRTSRIKSI